MADREFCGDGIMYSLIKKILFQMDPETAHAITLKTLRFAHALGVTRFFPTVPSLPCKVMGLHFPNPVGLAAGLDKNGEYIDALATLGFGFIEVGTVTPKPQSGNPKPRLFRLPEQEAIINRLGFNNRGVDYLVERLKRTRFNGILGVNIGKNKNTPLEHALSDYLYGFQRVASYASYVTINISSPNTENLRSLQHGELLQSLLRTLKNAQSLQKKYVPLVVKIAPDLTENELQNIAEILLAEKIDGVIATNTTLSREGVENLPYANEVGGLSGKPLFSRATKIIQQLYPLLKNKIPIIGCGGILSAQDAQAKFSAGAELIQVYTGLIYRGPGLVKELVRPM